MGQKKDVKLTPMQMDALREAVNIGAGNAANALSQMAECKVLMSVPKLSIVPVGDITDIVGHKPGGELLIRINIIGDAPGAILISMSMNSALLLSDILMEREAGETKNLNAMDLSAIQEAGHIMTGNYLRALETLLSVPFRSSVPFMAIDNEGRVLRGALSEFDFESDKAIVIESELKEKSHEIKAQFFLIPNPESLTKILEVLGVG
jgi:chemotaxis protein CheC